MWFWWIVLACHQRQLSMQIKWHNFDKFDYPCMCRWCYITWIRWIMYIMDSILSCSTGMNIIIIKRHCTRNRGGSHIGRLHGISCTGFMWSHAKASCGLMQRLDVVCCKSLMWYFAKASRGIVVLQKLNMVSWRWFSDHSPYTINLTYN